MNLNPSWLKHWKVKAHEFETPLTVTPFVKSKQKLDACTLDVSSTIEEVTLLVESKVDRTGEENDQLMLKKE